MKHRKDHFNMDNKQLFFKRFVFLMVFGCVILICGCGFKDNSKDIKTISRNQINEENRPIDRKHSYGGELIWGTTNPPTHINPILTTHSVSVPIQRLVFNRLVRVNSQMQIEPDLAERWDVSKDGLTYIFHLRRGVFFHDGVELTAEDVAFTYNQIIDPLNNSPYRSHFDLVKRFEAIDKYTFRIILVKSFTSLLNKLVQEIVPKHLLAGKDLKNNEFNEHPIGTGPFQFKTWNKQTDEIVLEANPYYMEGRPYLDVIRVKVYSNNSLLWEALMRHEVDFVKFLNKEDYQVLAKDHTFQVYEIPSDMYLAIVYNQRDPQWFDSSMRRVVAQTVDIEQMIPFVSADGIKSVGPFHPRSIGFNPNVKPIEYNPVKAKMELMAQGWLDENKDGIFEKGGRNLVLKLLVDETSDYQQSIAMIFRQQLAEIGVKVEVLLFHDEDDLTEEYLEKNKPQAWLRFFQGLGPDPYGALGSWYSGSSQTGRIWNYQNPEVDRLFEEGRASNDLKIRTEIYQELHEIIYADQPACFLFFPVTFHAVSSRFLNIDAFFSAAMPVYTLKDWYVN